MKKNTAPRQKSKTVRVKDLPPTQSPKGGARTLEDAVKTLDDNERIGNFEIQVAFGD